jgi:hypothetical protein
MHTDFRREIQEELYHQEGTRGRDTAGEEVSDRCALLETKQ